MLPESTLETVAQFLLGIDLFWLSHTSSYALQTFSRDDLWRPRLASPRGDDAQDISAKQAYMQQYSLVFNGSKVDGKLLTVFKWLGITSSRPSLTHVPVAWSYEEARHGPVSFDLWFSLAPDAPGCVRGGILLGAQSEAYEHDRWPNYHQQFALVDTRSNLYCSILDGPKQVIATNLQAQRWYHLALVYDTQRQRVYLDRELVSDLSGPLHSEWRRLYRWQVGAGCISGGCVGKPNAAWSGWLGFRGMMDDFCLWHHALSDDQIRQLGQQQQQLSEESRPAYSMKRGYGAPSQREHAQRVRCSRPLERLCRPLP